SAGPAPARRRRRREKRRRPCWTKRLGRPWERTSLQCRRWRRDAFSLYALRDRRSWKREALGRVPGRRAPENGTDEKREAPGSTSTRRRTNKKRDHRTHLPAEASGGPGAQQQTEPGKRAPSAAVSWAARALVALPADTRRWLAGGAIGLATPPAGTVVLAAVPAGTVVLAAVPAGTVVLAAVPAGTVVLAAVPAGTVGERRRRRAAQPAGDAAGGQAPAAGLRRRPGQGRQPSYSRPIAGFGVFPFSNTRSSGSPAALRPSSPAVLMAAAASALAAPFVVWARMRASSSASFSASSFSPMISRNARRSRVSCSISASATASTLSQCFCSIS